jgi:uncharacterized protein YbcV (DUF1398 family)
MFTIEQIKAAHFKVKSGADFPVYIQEIKQLGVKNYETFVADGHSQYAGGAGAVASSGPKYETLVVALKSNNEGFKKDLKEHQEGKTDYLAFCNLAAAHGVEKWRVDLDQLTCSYYDTEGEVLLVEAIPVP